MAEHGVPIRRVINGGGIPQKNPTLNRVYANVLNKPVLVPDEPRSTSLGSAIFAFLAAGAFQTIEEAQDALCPTFDIVEPDPRAAAVYDGCSRCTGSCISRSAGRTPGPRRSATCCRRCAAMAARQRGGHEPLAALRDRGPRRQPGTGARTAWSSTRSATRAASTATTGLVVIKPSGVPYDGADGRRPGGHRPRRPRRRGRVPALVRSADAPGALQGVPGDRRRRAHALAVRDGVGAGRPRDSRASARRTPTTSAAPSR